ncbi:MAG: arylamine N-acetyltransferase [Alphaproteobacteria bacterium]
MLLRPQRIGGSHDGAARRRPRSLSEADRLCRAARADSDRRFTLLDREFTTRHRDGHVERRNLADAADLADVLTSCFRIAPSAAERDAGAVWERISG